MNDLVMHNMARSTLPATTSGALNIIDFPADFENHRCAMREGQVSDQSRAQHTYKGSEHILPSSP
jgi:hypothetical protein